MQEEHTSKKIVFDIVIAFLVILNIVLIWAIIYLHSEGGRLDEGPRVDIALAREYPILDYLGVEKPVVWAFAWGGLFFLIFLITRVFISRISRHTIWINSFVTLIFLLLMLRFSSDGGGLFIFHPLLWIYFSIFAVSVSFIVYIVVRLMRVHYNYKISMALFIFFLVVSVGAIIYLTIAMSSCNFGYHSKCIVARAIKGGNYAMCEKIKTEFFIDCNWGNNYVRCEEIHADRVNDCYLIVAYKASDPNACLLIKNDEDKLLRCFTTLSQKE